MMTEYLQLKRSKKYEVGCDELLEDKEYLLKLSESLEKAERITISPHAVEGAGVIQISDELAKELSDRLKKIAENMK